MSAQERTIWTVEDYLAFERGSEQKHEYLNGEIFAMAGASPNHNIIAGTVNGLLYTQIREHSCAIYNSDQRLKITKTGLYTYPDITILCGEPKYDPQDPHTLLNPTLLIEILSPSTANYDRGQKFLHYRSLESLQAYLMIAQDSYHVELYTRQGDQSWLLTDFNDPQDVIPLSAIDCTLVLADIYEKVSFEA